MTRTRLISTGLTATGVAFAASVLALVAATGPAAVRGPQAAAAGSTSGATTAGDAGPAAFHLQDDRNGMHLAVMLDATSDHYAIVDVTIPGLGALETGRPATLSLHTPTSTTLSYTGPGVIDPREGSDSEFGLITDSAHSPNLTAAQVRLQGQLDPSHRSGELTVWVGGKTYHLVRNSGSAPAGAEQTAAAIKQDLMGGQVSAVYDLLDPSARASVGRAEFVRRFTAGLAGPVTQVSYGTFAYTTSTAGVDYANAPFSVTAGVSGTVTTRGSLQLIRVLGAWRLLQIRAG